MGPEFTEGNAIAKGPKKPKPERKTIQCAVPPSHPDFDRTKFSDLELIDLLLFENKENQIALRASQERVGVLEDLLRQHNIPLPSPVKISIKEVIKSPAPVEDEVPLRSARRRLGSDEGEQANEDSVDQSHVQIPTNAEKRASVASITSNGPIDVGAGMPISLNFKTELMAAAALESNRTVEPVEDHTDSAVLGRSHTDPIKLPYSFSGREETSPALEQQHSYENIAPQYISPSLLQEEIPISLSSPDVLKRAVNAHSPKAHSLAKQNSDGCFQVSALYKPRIRHPSKTEASAQDKVPSELLSPYGNSEYSEASTIGTRGSLRSSASHFDSMRDNKLGSKVVPLTPHIPQTPDAFSSSAMTPNLSHSDAVTLNSGSFFDSAAPISPIQRTPKGRHRDFFKIPNALSFGSSESVSNRTNTNPSSFQVLSPTPDDDDVPLFIKPEDFHTIRIKVVSTISVNAKRSDDPNCTFSINDKATDKEMWRIRKSYSQIVAFDNEIRPVVEFFGLPVLPDKSLFSSFTPSKVDSRLRLLQDYFNTIFNMPHIPQSVLYRICRYISLDFVNPLDDFKSGAKKEGFLIRRYKGLGTTWKVRWCQIEGPALEIYELPGGSLIEQIKLNGSQIGRQSSDVVAEERGYRHAFLVLESSRNSKISNSQPKHFFCAETDEERDSWIAAMVDFTDNDPLQNPENGGHSTSNPKALEELSMNRMSGLYNPALDESVPFEELKEPSTVDQRDLKEEKKMKKRSMFHFRSRAFSDELVKPDLGQPLPIPQPTESMQTYLDQMNLHDEPVVRVFGHDLVEVFKLSHHEFKGLKIPSICYRCFDFLDKKGAIYEEGIFRLSGSASAIRQLKQKFNVSLDVDLFETQLAPDVHTVAGLLKAYLRELPSPIFGAQTYNELQMLITENSGVVPNSRIALMIKEHLRSSSSVNPINYDFCVVIFGFLRSVIMQSSMNRMSLKNVCIVFVPTLNVSVEILSMCLVDYDCIFGDAEPTPDHKREVLDLQIPTF